MTVGDRIRFLRKQQLLTQEDVAKRINTSPQNIYKYEKGIITDIPLSKLQALADVLQTTTSYLLGLSTQENSLSMVNDQQLLSHPQLHKFMMLIQRLPAEQQSHFLELCTSLLSIPVEQRDRFLEALDIQLKLFNPPSNQ